MNQHIISRKSLEWRPVGKVSRGRPRKIWVSDAEEGMLSMIMEETYIRQELNIMSILVSIAQYRLNWWEHLSRIDDCRIPNHHGSISRWDGEVWDAGGSAGVTSSRPVSYTHLDVYKRQEYIYTHHISTILNICFVTI